MKSTSVIFLIISFVLILAGVFTCVSASRMAETNGIDLFYQDVDEQSNGVTEKNFSNTNKITLNLSDCDVKIIGGASESKVKLINFAINTYEYVQGNKNLTLNDGFGVMSMFNIKEGMVGFNGLRYYINFDRFKTKERSVEIYISNDNEIKQFDITIEHGNLSIDKITNQADFKINVNEGNVNIGLRKSVSLLDITVGKGDVNLSSVSYKGDISVKIAEGNLTANMRDNGTRAYDINSSSAISFYGENKGRSFSITPLEVSSNMTVDVERGSVVVNNTAETSAEQPAGTVGSN